MSAGPLVQTSWRLTGARRHRQGWLGHLILQVEEECFFSTGGALWPRHPSRIRRWRDAKVTDL